ncbi:hypothetical protein NM208_g15894 [Fusarium decemcellulare]|uniref:Uncharacterized protein n=1 Tax=Fusarium decemcellulare TaxID=57161 RepID=A0ACC1RBQ3_9HYPO|nr:hypothetical protein NM208_g15894 [Fusarium decemcellulare]
MIPPEEGLVSVKLSTGVGSFLAAIGEPQREREAEGERESSRLMSVSVVKISALTTNDGLLQETTAADGSSFDITLHTNWAWGPKISNAKQSIGLFFFSTPTRHCHIARQRQARQGRQKPQKKRCARKPGVRDPDGAGQLDQQPDGGLDRPRPPRRRGPPPPFLSKTANRQSELLPNGSLAWLLSEGAFPRVRGGTVRLGAMGRWAHARCLPEIALEVYYYLATPPVFLPSTRLLIASNRGDEEVVLDQQPSSTTAQKGKTRDIEAKPAMTRETWPWTSTETWMLDDGTGGGMATGDGGRRRLSNWLQKGPSH